ncbi:MAG: tetratricopeptide repeat protein [Armatimonadetes bacterium]|nr:tetratricopeptide repeat protein [Armatimonadota bacterium]
MTGSIAQTLEEFRQGGILDSSGRFSLDPLKARQKMERYRLAEPSLYVLSLVASAVAGGAGSILVKTSRKEFDIRHDGSPPDRETLEELFSKVLLAGNQSLTQFELAVGLNGALAQQPEEIVVESRDETGGHRLKLSASRHLVEPLEESEEPRREVRIQIRRGRRIWGNRADEAGTLEEVCCYCPIPISVNGRLINRELRWSPSLALRVLTSDIAPPVACGEPSGTPVFLREKSEVPYSAVFSVGALSRPEPGLILVVNGIAFQGGFEGFDDCPIQAVVNLCTAGLQKDVSQAGLVRNDGYAILMASLKVEMYNTLAAMAERWAALDSAQKLEALPLLDRLAEEQSRTGQLEEAAELYRRLVVFRAEEFGEHHTEVLVTFANLSVVNFLLGKVAEARAMMSAVAWDFMTTGEYARSATFFEKALELYQEGDRSRELVQLLQAYAVCLKELDRPADLERILERMQELDRSWQRPLRCRCCGNLELLREQPIQVGDRAALADMCPVCGYGEFQVEGATEHGRGDAGGYRGGAPGNGGGRDPDRLRPDPGRQGDRPGP